MSRIAKLKSKVKGITDVEKSVKQATQSYREMMNQVKDTEHQPERKHKKSPRPEGDFTLIPNSIIRKSNLTHTQFRIYVILLSYRFGKNQVQIGQRLLAKEAKTERRNLRRYLKSLEKKKYINPKRKSGHRTIYHLLKLK